jgi:hypothetical protein
MKEKSTQQNSTVPTTFSCKLIVWPRAGDFLRQEEVAKPIANDKPNLVIIWV